MRRICRILREYRLRIGTRNHRSRTKPALTPVTRECKRKRQQKEIDETVDSSLAIPSQDMANVVSAVEIVPAKAWRERALTLVICLIQTDSTANVLQNCYWFEATLLSPSTPRVEMLRCTLSRLRFPAAPADAPVARHCPQCREWTDTCGSCSIGLSRSAFHAFSRSPASPAFPIRVQSASV